MDTTVGSSFGKMVKQARKDKGMPIATLSRVLKVSRVTIYNIERGRHKVSLDVALRMMVWLRIPFASLDEIFWDWADENDG